MSLLTVPLQLGGPGPLVSFVVGVAVVVLLLVRFDFPAFIALVVAALTVGIVTPAVPLSEVPTQVATAFGDGMRGIGIPILMAAVIGKTMMESGAAVRIVRGFSSLTGEDNNYWALFGSGYVLSIPVFFDNVFYLLAPLARSMRARVGKNYTLFIVVIGASAATTHGFVPPTPGPLAVASELGINLGIMTVVGIAVAIPTALVSGVAYGKWVNRRLDIPLRDSVDSSGEELEEMAQRSTDELPGLVESLLPIVLAIVLVSSGTIVSTLFGGGTLAAITGFVGDSNVALTIAALAAAFTYFRVRDIDRETWSDELTGALRTGGNIAAITAAGGAFGALLAAAGVGDYIANVLSGIGLGLIVTSWVIAAAVRIAQGSATVALLTTAGIVAPLLGQLSVHPVYVAMAIGAGGTTTSWYNDSGFWLVKEIGGLTQAETLKTWTVLTTLIAITGLISVLVLSSIFPLA
ncbi:GntP family permease [Halococcus sp. AFM35]|uniref:GntP family permease n=1 Tax=Halococcus sp. AFM35 TaxID=3421653 RepID=UPI003EC02AAF